jgi:hypothetical protein
MTGKHLLTKKTNDNNLMNKGKKRKSDATYELMQHHFEDFAISFLFSK